MSDTAAPSLPSIGGMCQCGQAHGAHAATAKAWFRTPLSTALLHGLFPEPVLRRALLASVGAATVLGALSSAAAARRAQGDRAGEEAAREDQAQCRLPADHLRRPADLRRAPRPLRQGGTRGQPAEDRRHQPDPRQDDQRRARRLAAGHAGRADDDRRSRRHHAVDQGPDDLQPERQFAGARQQAQGQSRSEELEGLRVRGSVRAVPSGDAASQLSRDRTASIPTRT